MLSSVNACPCTPINTHQGPHYRPEEPAWQHYSEISTMRGHSRLQYVASDLLSKRLKSNCLTCHRHGNVLASHFLQWPGQRRAILCWYCKNCYFFLCPINMSLIVFTSWKWVYVICRFVLQSISGGMDITLAPLVQGPEMLGARLLILSRFYSELEAAWTQLHYEDGTSGVKMSTRACYFLY